MCASFDRHGSDPRRAYATWLLEKADRFGTFATLTYSRAVTRQTALKKGRRFSRLLNQSVLGNRFLKHNQSLLSVFSVEGGVMLWGRIAHPHLHFLIEKHPRITEESIRGVWAEVAGRKAANLGVNVESIRSVEDATRYILKQITWENGPVVYIPKSMLENTPQRSLRAMETQ